MSNHPYNIQESPRTFDEFSPKKMLLQIQGTTRYLLSQWWKILIAGVLSGAIGVGYSFTKKPGYVAEITFALDEGATPNARNDLNTLAQQLGLETSLEAGGVFSSMTNIGELMRSRLMIQKTLRTPAEIDGKKILFADFFLDSLDYREKWMKGSPYERIKFDNLPNDPKAIRFANGVLNNIYETLLAKNIVIEKKGKETTIVAARLVSSNELFSKYFLEAWIAEVTRYYIETKTQRSKLNLDFIQKKADSTRTAYNQALYGRAGFLDANINSIREIASVPGEKQQTDVQILKANYVQLMSALESAKTSLMRDTPLFQNLDTPILPLKRLAPNKMLYFVACFLIGVFLATGYLATRRGIRYIMKSP